MSELRADTITASDGTSPVALTKQSAAKVFAKFDQINVVIEGSLNTSSMTDNSAGNFNHNYTNNMSGATDHAPQAGSQAQGNYVGFFNHAYSSQTSSTMKYVHSDQSAFRDTEYGISVHGDLA